MGATSPLVPSEKRASAGSGKPQKERELGEEWARESPLWHLLWPFGLRRPVWHSERPLLTTHKLGAQKCPCFRPISILSLRVIVFLPLLLPRVMSLALVEEVLRSFAFKNTVIGSVLLIHEHDSLACIRLAALYTFWQFITSNKEFMCSISVCRQDYRRTTCPVFMTLGTGVNHGPWRNPVNVGADLNTQIIFHFY